MDLELSAEQRDVVEETTQAFVHRELMPHQDQVERSGRLDPELLGRLRDTAIRAGLYAANMPEEIGGGHAVRLGLVDPEDVRAASAELLARFPAVLVEQIVSGGIAELLVGVQSDPVFGPVLSVGVGGILTELVRDVAHLPLPAGPTAIRSALLGLRCAPLLTGYRGAPPADLDELVAVVERVAGHALDTPDLVEVEINPLIVTADGAWACDALVVTSGGGA